MIKYSDALLAFAQALHELLTDSESQEWFSVGAIARRAQIDVKGAFVSRVLTIAQEEGDYFIAGANGDNPVWTLGKEGFELIERFSVLSAADDTVAPASDRVVKFDHNAPYASEIEAKIAELGEDVRGANDPDIDEDERSRILSALIIAKSIWQSGQFKIIQFKVGVILAVEDAARLLVKTSKHAAAALLVDALKAIAKNHFHFDMDAV